ncbi:MAG: hypothetical protein CL685_03210 [Candidatus Magasanikbacteria bacterium]|nr:hypothetical protein [Candidatus Magasanikbacteria bacterium]
MCTIVPQGRFEFYDVCEDIQVKPFLQGIPRPFRAGCILYEFTKPVILRESNEVVAYEQATKLLYSGDEVRNLTGIPYGVRGRAKPLIVPGFTFFVQSTSHTRKLLGGTTVLYKPANSLDTHTSGGQLRLFS